MRRRTLITSVGILPITGCATLTTTTRETETKPINRDLDRREIIGLVHDGQEIGEFGAGIGAWGNVPYGFSVSTSSKSGIQWRRCTLEFTFPDEIRPPYIYLLSDTSISIASFDRRDLSDEFTTLEIQESVDEFNLTFSAEPIDSSTDNLQEIPMEVNFEGILTDNNIRETEYTAEGSIPITLMKSFD